MLLIIDRNFTKLPDKIEALKRYANRYFKKEAIYKSHNFMKMLIIADKSGYDISVTTAKTKILNDALRSTDYAHGTTYEGIEIVPYRDLWKMVLEALIVDRKPASRYNRE